MVSTGKGGRWEATVLRVDEVTSFPSLSSLVLFPLLVLALPFLFPHSSLLLLVPGLSSHLLASVFSKETEAFKWIPKELFLFLHKATATLPRPMSCLGTPLIPKHFVVVFIILGLAHYHPLGKV
jgi:hypothetical protein